MAWEPKYDIFRDPVHGFIKVYDVEKDIINSPPFQRLRRICQLGLTSLVYHGAEHSRFGHSIGVMDLASRVFDSLTARYSHLFKEILKWDDEKYEIAKRKLRLAALLHDIGHAPFSHAAEGLFPKVGDKIEKHDKYGEKIIDQTEIGHIIDKYSASTGVSKKDVLELVSEKSLGHENILLRNIFVGDLDVDRMDYLLRDSLYTGVQYGKFDSDRLIEKLGLWQKKEDGSLVIGIEKRGLHAAEGMLLARYFMFTQVYFHETRRIYDIHLTTIMQELLKEQFRCSEYPNDVNKYLELNDNVVFSFIEQKAKDRSLEEAEFVKNRTHYCLIDLTSEHAQGGEIERFNKVVQSLSTKFGAQYVIKDTSLNAPYIYRYQMGKDQLPVILEDEEPRDIAALSTLIEHLPDIYQLRVYVHPDKYNDAHALVKAEKK
jgi:HD superfamily phosphohydrolase